jgi:hypothetical protein
MSCERIPATVVDVDFKFADLDSSPRTWRCFRVPESWQEKLMRPILDALSPETGDLEVEARRLPSSTSTFLDLKKQKR